MTKLKVVTVTFSFVMYVDDAVDAEKCAKLVAQEAFRDIGIDQLDVYVSSLSKEIQLPEGWDITCYPYGCSNGTLSINDYLKEENDSISAHTNI